MDVFMLPWLVLLASSASLAGARSTDPWSTFWSGKNQIVQGTVTRVYYTDSVANVAVRPLGALDDSSERVLYFLLNTSASATPPKPGDYIIASGFQTPNKPDGHLLLFEMLQSISTDKGRIMADWERSPIAGIDCTLGPGPVPRPRIFRDGLPLLPIEDDRPPLSEDPAVLAAALSWSAGVDALRRCVPNVASW